MSRSKRILELRCIEFSTYARYELGSMKIQMHLS